MAGSDRQMTVSEMAEDARRDHRSYRNELWGGVYCRTDNERWPCRSTLLLDEVERLQALLAERDAEIVRLVEALTKIVDQVVRSEQDSLVSVDAIDNVGVIARAALAARGG